MKLVRLVRLLELLLRLIVLVMFEYFDTAVFFVVVDAVVGMFDMKEVEVGKFDVFFCIIF